MCPDRVGYLTDVDIEDSLKKGEIKLDVQLYGARDNRNADGSDQQGGSSINIGEYLFDNTIYKDMPEKRSRAEGFVNKNITPSGVDVTFDSFHPVYCVSKKCFLNRKCQNTDKKTRGCILRFRPARPCPLTLESFLSTQIELPR